MEKARHTFTGRTKSKSPNITFVVFYPSPETLSDPGRKFAFACHYRALALTYKITIYMINTAEELQLFNDNRPFISIEEKRVNKGSILLQNFNHARDVIYLLGSSVYPHPSDLITTQNRIHIDVVDSKHPLYGDQCAAMIMYDRSVKGVC